MRIEISFENGMLKMLPSGKGLSKEKIIETLSLAYCSACKGYGVEFTDCSSFSMNVASDVYFDKEAINARIERINKEENVNETSS